MTVHDKMTVTSEIVENSFCVSHLGYQPDNYFGDSHKDFRQLKDGCRDSNHISSPKFR